MDARPLTKYFRLYFRFLSHSILQYSGVILHEKSEKINSLLFTYYNTKVYVTNLLKIMYKSIWGNASSSILDNVFKSFTTHFLQKMWFFNSFKRMLCQSHVGLLRIFEKWISCDGLHSDSNIEFLSFVLVIEYFLRNFLRQCSVSLELYFSNCSVK